jgi:hypothetical protein
LVYGLHYNRLTGFPRRLEFFIRLIQTATSPQRKPLLDEASFQQLLQAAHVLQEHNDRLRAKGVQADFAENLSAIVETQKLIQTLQLDLTAASELVAERVQKITNASGAAIGIIDKGQLFYRAATGSAAQDAGTRIAPDSALSADCINKGSALNYPDVTPSLHVNSESFRERDVKGFIAVPVYHAGQVAGVLELRFARANSFREADLRSAELMAGLLSEAMVTAARMKWKEALASERQSMLEALERIKPQLERLGSDSLESVSTQKPPTAFSPQVTAHSESFLRRMADTCPACGSEFFDESESFCGICGTARPVEAITADPEGISAPIKTDLPWLTPYEQESPSNGHSSVILPEIAKTSTGGSVSLLSSSVILPEPQLATATSKSVLEPSAASHFEEETTPGWDFPHQPLADAPTEMLRIVPADIALEALPADQVGLAPVPGADQIQAQPWTSAKTTQDWLQTVKTRRSPRAEWLAQQWQRRRANIYLVFAAVILLLAITGWGIRPAGTTAAGNAAPAGNSQVSAPAPPEMSLFEKLMVNLGLAEPPPAPVNLGNPNTQVWVDVHTALYYCADSELYGKTADGKFTSQKDAQQDQFGPANRKACP